MIIGSTLRALFPVASRLGTGIGSLTIGLAALAQTPIYTNLHTFTGPDGANPVTELIEASNGTLYGVCSAGGTSNLGTIFGLNRDGSSFAVLHHFGGPGDGASPEGLIEASDGALYGTTYQGGTSNVGVVFRMDKVTSNYAVLCSLTDSRNPLKGVIEGSDGALYGTTYNGAGHFYGTVFTLNKDGSNLVTIHGFDPTAMDGCNPIGTVVEASNGRLYGTTSTAGIYSSGTVYGLNKDGSNFQVLYSFRYVGVAGTSSPHGGLLEGNDGALYGTTTFGISPAAGCVFKINKDGSGFDILHTFGPGYPNDGANSWARLLQGSDEMLYGTTRSGGASGVGVIFKLAIDGTDYSTVHDFGNVAGDGQEPITAPREGADGALYGTTSHGGAGYGTVYRLTGPGRPVLNIRLLATNSVLISWPAPATEFHLEQNPDLASSNWTSVNQTPTNDGKTNSVTMSLTSMSMVYRLKSQ